MVARERHNLSPKAQEVWDQLDQETRNKIQKDNPFKWNRDQAIRELKAKGLRVEILTELTGLHRHSIFRIAKKETLIPERQRQEIKVLIETFNAFLRTLIRLLPDRFRKEDERKQS